MKKIAILISGRGSNLQAILEQRQKKHLPFETVVVISNEPRAGGLAIAKKHKIETRVVDHRAFPTRETFEAELDQTLVTFAPDLIVLAGFMRMLTAGFVNQYQGRIINIHPSLLPAYPGLHTHRRALADGIKIHGCTVHFVTPQLDLGPIIVQAAVPVLPEDDETILAARVMEQEHRIYPQAVSWFCEGRLKLTKDGIVRLKSARAPDEVLCAPALDTRMRDL
jgi:phosphoribosylglycinamide formyltransferase-1